MYVKLREKKGGRIKKEKKEKRKEKKIPPEGGTSWLSTIDLVESFLF